LSKSLKESLKTVFGDQKYTADMRWKQLEADELDKYELAIHLEDKHDIRIPDEKLMRAKTLGHLQHLLNNSMTTTLKKAAAYLSSLL
jgi:acyl carrier protein